MAGPEKASEHVGQFGFSGVDIDGHGPEGIDEGDRIRPASSTLLAMAVMSVTFGESLTTRGNAVAFFTSLTSS